MEKCFKPPFYEYGGIKDNQNTKLHICDNSTQPLCGVKSNWMEAAEQIPDSGNVHANYWIGNISDADNTCKRCLKKWLSLKSPLPSAH